jgi:putative transposon-encoded protein
MKQEITNKVMNSLNEYLKFSESLIKEGLMFEKKVTKFSKTSAAIYLPKRLIGRTFKVFLMPITDPYEISEPELTDKKADKLIKDTEKDLEKIQKETETKRKNLLDL